MSEHLKNPEALSVETVGPGSVVTVHYMDELDSATEIFQVIEGGDAYSDGTLPTGSPLGKVIIGAKTGDTVSFSIGREVIYVKIIDVK